MRIAFTKMHGLGNDFVVVRGHGLEPPSAARIRELADRRRGIGFDQLLWLDAPRNPAATVAYRIFNVDGSEAEQCGNGARCIARLVSDDRPGRVVLEHARGLSEAVIAEDGSVSVCMGIPEFDPPRIPFVADREASSYELGAGAEVVTVGVVSMGNPHAVLRVSSVESAPVARLGPLLERHARFPNRANIGFVEIVSPDHVRLRVFERGVGETRACGTGACAAVAIGRRSHGLEPQVRVELPGGELAIRWAGPGEPIWMTGEAVTVFEGMVEV